MNDHSASFNTRFAGLTTITGAITMLAGAATWVTSGTDLDATLTGGSMSDYLISANAASATLHLNITLWTLGAVLMCAGGCQLALMGRARPQPAGLACFAYAVGAGSAIVFFPLWLGIIKGLAPAHAGGTDLSAVAIALGEAATIADWVDTVMILAVGSICVAQAGKESWVPRWLVIWSYVVGVAGLLALIGLFTGDRSTYAMLIVPVGVGWLIAAGVVAMRQKA